LLGILELLAAAGAWGRERGERCRVTRRST
jgi:hypothetical protein